MAEYKIEFKKSAVKEIKKLPDKDLVKILSKINSLKINPRPLGCSKLSLNDLYRIRFGNYRIIYQIFDDRLLIIVIKIGHRKEVYR